MDDQNKPNPKLTKKQILLLEHMFNHAVQQFSSLDVKLFVEELRDKVFNALDIPKHGKEF